MTAILLLGCNGQLGYESRRALTALGTVVARDFPDIDFSQPESLRALVREVRPDVIVNAAAYTAVDKAENEPEKARTINAIAPGVLAEEAQALGAILVHYSTDYVFDGTKVSAYVESDRTCPLSVYGLTKREGELAVTKTPKSLIFRTSWVVGIHGANFVKTMLRLAGERETLRVVADQVGAPTSAKLLAETTAAILDRMVAAPAADPRWGLYHLTAAGATSWNGLARRVIETAIANGVPLKTRSETVEEITTSEYSTLAKRPANSRLDTTKLRTAFGIDLPDWRAGVDEVVTGIVKEMQA